MTGTYLKQLCAALVSSTPDKRGNWRIFITFELPMLSAVFRAPLSLVHAKTNIERQQRSRSPARILEVDLRRSEEHTSELQSLMRISYAVFCLQNRIRVNMIPRKLHSHKRS